MKSAFRLTPALVALISGVLMLIFTTYEVVHERVDTVARAELQTQNFSKVLEEHARQTLHRVGANLARVDAELLPLRNAGGLDVVKARQLLTQMLPADQLIQQLALLDATGALVVSTQTNQRLEGGPPMERDYFAPHVRGADRELVFGRPVKGAGGEWLLPVSKRVGNADSAFAGALVAMVRTAYFQSFYDSIERGPDGLATLFLSSGAAVVTSPAAEAVMGRNWSDSPMFRQHLPAWPTGTVRQVVVKDGIDRIYSYRALNDYPVVVTYGLSLSTILASWKEGVWHDAILLAAALALLVGATLALKRQEALRLAATADLEASELHLRSIIEAEPECIKIVDAQGRLVAMNPAGLAMIEANSLQQVAGQPVLDLIAPEHRVPFNEMHQRVLAGETVAMAFEVQGLKGGRRWLETHAVPLQHHGETVQLAVTRDITERKLAEQTQRIAATAFESQQGMTVTDAQRVILRVNKAFTTITGYSSEEAVGQTPQILYSGRHDIAFYAAMTKTLETAGTWQGEIWNRRKNGEIYPEWLTISAVKDDAGATTHYVSIFNDISERVNAQAQIDTLAFYDPLTQLPNRRLLLDRLEQALHDSVRRAHQNALLFVDLDNFKTLNDTLGHFQGDALLVQVAQRLKACVRDGDTVARLGGDEFVVMLEDLGDNAMEAARQAEAVGEKVLNAFVPTFAIENAAHHSTPSIGVTLFGGALVEGSEQPLKRAELAMFRAKAAGRNTLRFFDTQMQAEVSAHAALEADLRAAVQQQQFVLYYQPQVVGADRISGVEALVRWQHPKRGIVSPAEFIPLAEQTGLILQIGHWVLDTACAQLAAWSHHSALQHLTMAVNVSARQFQQPDFVDSVLQTLARNAASPKLLKLELTESMLVNDVEGIIEKMSALKAKGVSFSLDDFGTGYSSLSYLKRMPLAQLKIDQGFVRNIVTDPNDAAIAKMVVALAESLGLAVIAEGVELQAQADFLAHMGCHAYQGYHFSRPLPQVEFAEFAQGFGPARKPVPGS
jgi:diguanylate cyclase (GGDEF)-like protein/PAS domain S-box-containing protein